MERTKLILPNINIKNIDNTLECFLKQVHSSDEYKKKYKMIIIKLKIMNVE